MNFYPFFKGVANFKFIFLSHFSTNFERFGAYPSAFMMNFPKHTNFFPFWWISAELWPLFLRSHFFLTHPVYIYISIHLHVYNIYISTYLQYLHPAQARPPRPQPHLLGHQPRAARPPRAGGLPQPRDLLWVLGRIKYILDRVAKFQA